MTGQAEFASLAGTLSLSDPLSEIADAAPEPDAEPLLLRPHVALELVHYTPEMLELVPREIAERHCLLPVYLRKARPRRKIPGVLFLAMADPADASALEECGFCSGLTVKPLMAERWALRDAIPIVYAGGSPVWVRATPPGAPPAAPSSAAPSRPVALPPAAPPVSPPVSPAGGAAPVSAAGASSSAGAVAAASMPPVATARSAETTVEVSEASLDDLGELGDLGDLGGQEASEEGAADTVRDPDEPRHGLDPAEKSGQTAQASEKPEDPRGFVLLVVSASAALADFCREAVEPLGGRIETCDVVDAPLLALAERPRFLIVAEEIYPFDRRAFNLLAIEIGAPLIVWSLDMTPEDLQALLLASGKKRLAAS